MASLFEGKVEFKGRGGWRKAHGVVTRGKLDLFDSSESLMHTVILSPTSKFKDGKTKRKEFHFDVVTAMSEHHFRVESEVDRKQWGDYIKIAVKSDDYSKAATLPVRRKPVMNSSSHYVTDFRSTPNRVEGCYDTPQLPTVHCTEPTRLGSPTDSGFEGDGSGGGQFSRSDGWPSAGLSDDGVIRHGMMSMTVKSPTNLSNPGTRSAGNSPFTSPATSADGTFLRLNKYKWYLGPMTREEATATLMKEKGQVFGLRENNKGSHVLSIKKFDKASNQFKVSHHLIKTEGNDFRIDGITTFSGTDILDLLKQFMKNCPESPPLGGSLSALKQGMVEEEDPHYDYPWDPEEMGGLIQQRIKEQALAEGGQYVGAPPEQGSADKVKYNRAREIWKPPPPHGPQKKPPASGRAPAAPQGRTYSTSNPQAKLVSDLTRKLGKVSTSDSKGKVKPSKKPLPAPTAKPRPQHPEESQPLYGNADAENAHVYGNVDFGDQIYANTVIKTDQISGVTKEVPKRIPRARNPGKAGPTQAPSQHLPPTVPPKDGYNDDYYDAMDGEIYEDMDADACEEDEDMYVVPNPGEEEGY